MRSSITFSYDVCVCLCAASDMKKYLLDLGQKVDILDVKLDIVGTILDVGSDAWAWKKNKTADVWGELVQTWEDKKEAVADHFNKTGNARGYANITTITKADVWDSLVSKLGYVKNATHETFDDVLTVAGNVLEWKWNKTTDIVGAIGDFVEYKKNQTVEFIDNKYNKTA
jgi:ethanolamine utilization protein EutP (predicted NTPase)